jgi:hypothetical protein
MAQKKLSFKKGTVARAARGKIAEQFKAEGDSADSAFAKATAITKRASKGGQKKLAQKGLK